VKTPLTLGAGIEYRMLVPCPRCPKRHRVLQREEGTLLDYIRCNGELMVVGIEGRFLPCQNGSKQANPGAAA
jgi:hypothetical protein